MLQYISTTDVNQHRTLLAVLRQLLKLSPEETAKVEQIHEANGAGVVGGLVNWLSPYSS